MGKMSKERNPREYFEYNEEFIQEINKIKKETDDEKAKSIAQSMFEIVKGTLETSAASSVEKKSILEGFAETVRDSTEEQNELPESDKIEAQSIVFDKFAEKLAESIQGDETPTKIFEKYEEQLQEIVTTIKPQELAQDIFCLPEEEKIPLELGESLLDVDTPVFSAADRTIDPIIQAIRVRILTKQRELIVTALVKNNTVKKEEIDDLNKFRAYFENEQNKETTSKLLEEDRNLKYALEQVEIVGYKNVHTQFADRFSTMEWKDGVVENANGITTKQQIVRDADGRTIATLKEATHQINPPHTVQKSDGTNVTINNYRTIDFPITLDNNGPMHLSLAVKDQNGRNIAASKAVYFTAHYDDDGKLVEVSSPHPVKFSGNNPDAVGYIEHGGQIYTLPVTQEKYKAMMQEVAKNLGQGVDISPSIDIPSSVDLAVTSRQNIEEAQPNKGQETRPSSTDMVNTEKMESNLDIPEYPPIYEKVKVTIEEKTTEQLYAPKISQAVLIKDDVRDKAENIKASLSKSQHIHPPTRKTDADIAKLVRELSRLESEGFEEQKKHIGTTLEKLSTPQEKIKLLQGIAKATAEQRGKEINKIYTRDRKPDVDVVRLLTENRGRGREGGVVKPQQRTEHANIKDDIKLQTFLRNKIDEINEEVPKKPTINVKARGAGSPGF